ncbi:hypothetical protein [Longimicrobium sp.]|uniref:hypothetical protein n=1 Tax=Longimicrobium sp. TaxID=2029185 RepID=UPI002E2FA977|nr:hypothetical protein [Longimicrobium sp.]HEX6042640.1 hypothetical protein [Longimicrobium sp.]
MGNLFSEISGKFSKSLIFGCFFPVVFFLLLDWIFFRPFIPPLNGAAGALAALDPKWQTVALAGLAVLFSGLLYTLNRPITRFYEGYPWQHSLVGQWRKRRQVRQWKKTRGLALGVDAVLRTPEPVTSAANPPATETAEQKKARERREKKDRRELQDREDTLSDLGDGRLRAFHRAFPSSEGSVLPTRLGNVIRSFEDYPQRQYRMSAIYLWPRLVGVIDKEYAAAADDAKSSFDFMMNVSFLSGASAGGLLLLGLASRGIWGLSLAFWLQVAGLMIACYVFYAGSIGQAMAWGDLVRGAFDLYRGKLLAQMGFTQKPADLNEERALWRAISLQMVFGDPPAHTGLPLLRYAEGGTYAVGSPAKPLDVSRSAKQVEGGSQTCLLIHNPYRAAISDVRVTDSLPPGERYLWGSALSEGEALTVTGTDPITISVGAMEPNERRIVVYRSTK